MTAETSNARGETYTFDMIEDAWGDVVPLTKPYFNRFRARLETLRQSADPPPAAEGVQAGEVEQQPEARGVVDAKKLAHLIREWELHDKTFGHDGRHPLIADFRALLPAALTGERNG